MSKNLGWSIWAAFALAGCGAADGDIAEQEVPLAHAELAAEAVPTLDEFVESTRQTRRIGDEVFEEHVLEGDMIVSYEMVVAYYEAMYVTSDTVRKGVGITLPTSSTRVARPFIKYDPLIFPTISYCFDDTFSASEKGEFVNAVATATALWDGASGPLSFTYASNLDGASCSASSQRTLGFRVTRARGNVSQGSFPVMQDRILSLVSARAAGNILHEVGHIIGLAHEGNHTQATLNCPAAQFTSDVPAGAATQDITTTWDAQSVMQNRDANELPACFNSGEGFAFLSIGDKVSARFLYGN